jgi:hypothetical protein
VAAARVFAAEVVVAGDARRGGDVTAQVADRFASRVGFECAQPPQQM